MLLRHFRSDRRVMLPPCFRWFSSHCGTTSYERFIFMRLNLVSSLIFGINLALNEGKESHFACLCQRKWTENGFCGAYLYVYWWFESFVCHSPRKIAIEKCNNFNVHTFAQCAATVAHPYRAHCLASIAFRESIFHVDALVVHRTLLKIAHSTSHIRSSTIQLCLKIHISGQYAITDETLLNKWTNIERAFAN